MSLEPNSRSQTFCITSSYNGLRSIYCILSSRSINVIQAWQWNFISYRNRYTVQIFYAHAWKVGVVILCHTFFSPLYLLPKQMSSSFFGTTHAIMLFLFTHFQKEPLKMLYSMASDICHQESDVVRILSVTPMQPPQKWTSGTEGDICSNEQPHASVVNLGWSPKTLELQSIFPSGAFRKDTLQQSKLQIFKLWAEKCNNKSYRGFAFTCRRKQIPPPEGWPHFLLWLL